MTNYEKIKNMTLEEMINSGIINKSLYYGKVPAYEWDSFDHTYYGDDKLGCKQWLEEDSNSKFILR